MRDRSLNYLIAAVIAILLVVTVPLSAGASSCEEIEQEIAQCAVIVGELERLEYYDQLARSLGLVSVQTEVPLSEDAGAWKVSIKTNPLDDSRTVTLILLAESGTNRRGDPVGLILRCSSNRTDVYIAWQDYLGSEADVTWRVGDEDARTARWSLSTTKEATFYPYDEISFIQQLLTTTRFVAQVTPYNENPITAVFDLTGLTNVIGPLQEACGWE